MKYDYELESWEGTSEPLSKPIGLSIGKDGRYGVTISLEGHGLNTMETGQEQVIYIEQKDGEVRVLIWADINEEEPTHVIDLSKARETNRSVSVT